MEKHRKKLSKHNSIFTFDPKYDMNLSKLDKKNLEKLEKYEQFKWDIEVATMRTGASFGELALISDDTRKATITCIQEC